MGHENPGLLGRELANFNAETAAAASASLTALIRPPDLVGDLFRIDYASSEVLVHDHSRQKVGGLPLGCFLLATRLAPGSTPPPGDEDTCLLLLRVTGQSRLPNASETDLNRFQAGQRVASSDDHWDAEGRTDKFTLHQLRYAGVSCRVLGTFRMRASSDAPTNWRHVFGADLSNFYAGRGMKVYKPVGESLGRIVNFAKAAAGDEHRLHGHRVPVGRVRYASSERVVDGPESVPVELDPTDLVARRTALFGMSRTGKSNTTKVIAASVFRLREKGARVGQLVFDVNGKYANENAQDGGALKGVMGHTKGAKSDDVSTYGMTPHPNDPSRLITKINFFGTDPARWADTDQVRSALEPLLVGKSQVNALLSHEDVRYVSSFRDTSMEMPNVWDKSAEVRYRRAVFVYRAALCSAGFEPPTSFDPFSTWRLFSKDVIQALKDSTSADAAQYARAAIILEKDRITGDEAAEVCSALHRFIKDRNKSGYAAFNTAYAAAKEGRS